MEIPCFLVLRGDAGFFKLAYLRNMKYFVLPCLFFLLQITQLQSQFADDFSDGNLNEWQGDVSNFIVNGSGQLQLNAPSGSTSSWIHTPVTFIDSMVWDLYFRLDFAPSTSNLLRIYLATNNTDLTTASGYFLEIGATGDVDAIDLKYLDNGVATTIGSSVAGLVAFEPVDLRIRVVRDSKGSWQIYNTGGALPELLFSASHDVLPLSTLNTFGFYQKYTDTRRDKFRYDDINIAALQADESIPQWISLTVVDDNTVSLLFNENLDPVTSADPSHYLLTPGGGNPAQVELNGNSVTLTWAQPFVNLQENTLTIHNIQDPAGNILVNESKTFTFTKIGTAKPFDLMITEIMADPTPVIGLPDAEYLEIYNAGTEILNLGDYKIRVGTTDKDLPDSLIYPKQFVILTDDSNIDLLSPFGRVVALGSMSTLSNSGATLALLNGAGEILHQVNYDPAWYNDPVKSTGGWSLEMINPLFICAEGSNWNAASNLIGGTPGQVNSQWSTAYDVEGPSLISLFTPNTDEIELRFDEHIETGLMLNPALYVFEPALSIQEVELINDGAVRIVLAQSLQEGVIYHLLPVTAVDCIGNPKTGQDTIVFGLVASAAAGDVLINEILFNPGVGGSRFIEIINASQKFIDLSSLSIARVNALHNDIYPTHINEILAPGAIAAFTSDPSDIKARYTVPHPEKLYDAIIPTWDEDADQVSILSGGMYIDSFTYSADWHHPVISDQNGVSLERISITAPTSSRSTWHSASSVSGYATPTGPNSQSVVDQPGAVPFELTNKQFSPNDDGHNDFLTVNFSGGSGDDIASIWVYDLEGRIIRQLLSNESIGTSALIQWDGRNVDGQLADMGIYIIFVQLWDPQGNVKEYQKSCALVKR